MDAKPRETNATSPGGREGDRREGNGGPEGLTEVLDSIRLLAGRQDMVTVHELREEIGERSFGPFLLVPALIEISPIGGIPGLPTLIAIIISLFCVQILFGRKHLWLPQFVETRRLKADKLKTGMDKLRPVARWTDKLLKPRLKWLTKPPWLQGIAAVCILLCCTVPPLELIPFASTAPMGAIALFGLSLLSRDGLVATLAGLVSLSAVYLVYTVATGVA
jgi:hypothetical protein